jgi:hypothetical protein
VDRSSYSLSFIFGVFFGGVVVLVVGQSSDNEGVGTVFGRVCRVFRVTTNQK